MSERLPPVLRCNIEIKQASAMPIPTMRVMQLYTNKIGLQPQLDNMSVPAWRKLFYLFPFIAQLTRAIQVFTEAGTVPALG